MDYKGMDISDWDNDSNYDNHRVEFDTWCTTNNIPEYTLQYMQYLTSYSMIDSNNIIAILNEQAILHGFTKTDMFNQRPLESADQFYFQNHYSLETFQGIMPNTGAAGVSTVGENQFLIL
jgi:hypothetical protein